MNIIVTGEILWDVFADARHIGGACLNVAAHLKKLGENVAFISAVGTDDLGREALERVRGLGLDTRFVPTAPDAPTGTVSVFLTDGQPDFTIHRPAAYGFPRLGDAEIEALEALEPSWIAYGTLAQTAPAMRAATRRLIETFPRAKCFYDINLRKNSFTPTLVLELLEDTDVLKLNDEEMPVVAEMLGIPCESSRAFAETAAERAGLECVCVTRGAKGSALWRGGEYVESRAPSIRLADAVGAGDAFSAALIHCLGRGCRSLAATATFANRLGALVASRSGAVPDWRLDELPANGESS